jgi:predicted phage tail protein
MTFLLLNQHKQYKVVLGLADMKDNILHGSGGGGGGKGGGSSKTPVEAPNTLQSKTIVKFIDLIGSGEIRGLVDGDKSVYLNDTPLQNSDGTYNFKGISYAFRAGTPSQSYVSGFEAAATEVSVSAKVTKLVPITRTISNENVNRVNVKIRIPALNSIEISTGNTNGTTVAFQIKINGVVRVNANITDKCTSPYDRGYDIDIGRESYPVNIQVVRLTDDSQSQRLSNDTVWLSYSEIIDERLTYPGYAYFAINIDAQNFGNQMPERAYDCYGRIIQIPANYNPIARSYSGMWDGNFQLGWTDNPAWVLYDLLTNKKYGLGTIIDSDIIDKYTLYSMAQYCDALVPDGIGGYEPRYRFNAYINQSQAATDLIASVMSCMRGNFYPTNGMISFTMDRSGEAVKLVNKANVIDGKFTYSSASASQRVSVVVVTFNDPEDSFRQAQEVVEDMDLIMEIGDRRADIVAPGCTSRGQAHRFGKWYLETQSRPTQMLSYKTGLDHADLRPGDIIDLHDDDIAGKSLGGRLLGISGTTLTLDRQVQIESGKTYTAMIVAIDGTIEKRTITTGASTTDTVTVSTGFSATIDKMAIFIIKVSDLEPRKFRVIKVAQGDSPLDYTIDAMLYDSTKYDRIELGINLSPPQTSIYGDFFSSSPQNLTVKNTVAIIERQALNQIDVTWLQMRGALYYEYQWRINSGTYTPEAKASFESFNFYGADGTYDFLVRAVDVLGRKSQWAYATRIIDKSGQLIPNISNFVTTREGNIVLLQWDRIRSELVDFYEIRKGESWNISQVVATTTNTQLSVSDPKAATYLIKAHSYYGDYSETEAVAQVFSSAIENVVVSRSEADNNWNGIMSNFYEEGNKLYLYVDTIVNDIAELTAEEIAEYTGETLYIPAGIDPYVVAYYETPSIDLGRQFNSRYSLIADFEAVNDQTVDQFCNVYDTVDDIPISSIAGGDPNAISLLTQISISDDGVNWSEWADYSGGFYNTQYFKLRIKVSRTDIGVLPVINDVNISVDVPDVSETRNDEPVPIDGLTFYYEKTYTVTPTVTVAIQNGAIGDNYTKVSTLTNTVFKIYDASGVAKEGLIDINIKGY